MSSNRNTTEVHKLIAHFLQENNYPETLKQFESEHGSPIEPSKLIDESLTEIINDRINFSQLSNQFENQINIHDEHDVSNDIKAIVDHQFRHWISPSPTHREKLIDLDGLVISSSYHNGLVYMSTSSSKVYVLEQDGKSIHHTTFPVVIKKIIPLENDHDELQLLFVGMNGMFYLSEWKDDTLNTITEFPAHKRLIVDAKYIKFNDTRYIITLGWDFYLRLIKLENQQFSVLSEVKLTQQGTCFDVTNYENQLVIVLGKLENTLLDVYTINQDQLGLLYKISLNDAEFTSSSFSPRCITIQSNAAIPVIAVATSHEPYMRLIIVSLKEIELIQQDSQNAPIKRNQIIKNLNTMSPQDKYSQPIISWRLIHPENTHPKNSGVWIMGDDGVIRGVDLIHEKPILTLSGAHQGKIKEFITYFDSEYNERLISCGVDREVTIWK